VSRDTALVQAEGARRGARLRPAPMPAEWGQPPDRMQDLYEAERQWLTSQAAFPSPQVRPPGAIIVASCARWSSGGLYRGDSPDARFLLPTIPARGYRLKGRSSHLRPAGPVRELRA
jgi:hypothetical protein